jgi:RNA polymerase sigma-70 factor (ECF subfamily)
MEIDKISKQFLDAYDKYADDLFRHVIFRVSDKEAAKELLQETFMKTWEYMKKGNKVDEIRPFLYRVLHNQLIDYLRKRKPQVSLDELSEDGFDIAHGGRKEEESRIDAKKLLVLLDELEESYRNVLVMRYVDDMTIQEIAELTGDQPNSISVRLHRALKKLKELHDERLR